MRKYFLFLLVFMLFSFSDTSLKKRISDAVYRYEFYTTNEDITPKEKREYHWFKGGKIHSSEYGVGGELLHDDYLKFYHSNQLAEAGKFKYGLREGYWKTWFSDGGLQSKVYWSEGQMDGTYLVYDANGSLTEEGNYKNNRKHGRWINYNRQDTLKYRNGEIVVEKVKIKKDSLDAGKKPSLIKRMFRKKPQAEAVGPADANNQKVTSVPNDGKKPAFFKRLFKKKDKTAKPVKQPKKAKVQKEGEEGFFKRLFSKKQ